MGSTYLANMLPELILTIGACVALFVGMGRDVAGRSRCAWFSLATLVLAFIASIGAGVPDAANSPPGLLLTSLTLYVRCIALGMGVLILLVNWDVPSASEHTEFFSLLLFSVLGVLMTASANDLVVLFLALELVSVPTYVLVALSRENPRASEASVKYFFLGALSAALMVYGFCFLYGASGTTTLQAGAGRGLELLFTSPGAIPSYATVGLLLALAGLFFKIAAVPFHVYAPDVYEGAASPVTGMLGFLPKAAGFVALVKILGACGWVMPEWLMWLLWIVAALTMTVGNTLALRQSNVKRTLAYSSIAHSGYMLIAVLVGPVAGEGPMRDGVTAMLFYIAVYGAMNLGAFAVLAALQNRGESVEEFDELAGLSRRHPGAALALAICAFSLMGFPPTAGFLAKVYVFFSAFSLAANHAFREPLIVLAVIGVINSAIAAAYYLRIAGSCYLREPLVETERAPGAPLRLGFALCSVAMLVLFVWPGVITKPAQQASASAQESAIIQSTELAVRQHH
jgi:NADH-quinone oxidoreductase subunit N